MYKKKNCSPEQTKHPFDQVSLTTEIETSQKVSTIKYTMW